MVTRGLVVGALYGLAHFALELGSAAALMTWLGTGTAILRELGRELVGLGAGYLVVGAALGVLVAGPAAALRRRLPWIDRGPGLEWTLLATAFVAIAATWNAASVLPFWATVGTAYGAPLLLLPAVAVDRLGGARARRIGLAITGAGVAIAAGYAWVRATPPSAPAVEPGKGPNVVVLVVDTLRRDHVGAYGYARDTTPNLDRIASEGVVYDAATTTGSWTLPGHASLFTGLYVRQHHADAGHPVLETGHRTLAGELAAAGWRTAGFSANPWLSRASGLDQGFGEFRYLGVQTTLGTFWLSLALDRWRTDLGGEAVTDAVVDWIAARAAEGAPFFAFVNWMEAHEPYGMVPEPYFSRWLKAPLPRDAGKAWVRDVARYQCASCDPADAVDGIECRGDRWRVTPDRLAEEVALYDAGVAYVDHQIGRVRAALETAGVLDDTLLVVTADHGETLGERGRMGHGAFLYESVLDVPLVVRYPRALSPRRDAEPASLVDVMPTIEALAGVPVTPGLAGASLLGPRRAGPAIAEYEPVSEAVWRETGERIGCDMRLLGRASTSARVGDAKLIDNGVGGDELYDLAADPREEDDRWTPDGAAPLQQALEAWRAGTVSGVVTTEAPERDAGTKAALEALGYVQ